MDDMPEVSAVWRVVEDWLQLVPFPPSQSRIAERVGVSRSAVSDWKSGKTRPSPEHLEALAEMMEPQLGRDVGTRLAAALLRDMGYKVDKRVGDNLFVVPDGISRRDLDERRTSYDLIIKRMVEVPPRSTVRQIRWRVDEDGLVVLSLLFNDSTSWAHRALDANQVKEFVAAGYDELASVSEPSDTTDDLVAADEQDQSISGEQEESETP